jgi:TonB family protein
VRRARTVHRFYDLLSPDQRKAFDEATAPTTHEQLATIVTQPRPETPDYSAPSHTNPDWLVRPTPEELARVYPRAAAAKGVGGRAVLTCTVDVDGYLSECVVDSDTPSGAGFGNAALEITAYMRFLPMTDYGIPHESKVTVPINFAPDPDTAAATPPPVK